MSNSSNRLATLVSGTSVTANWTNGPRVWTLDNLTWTQAGDGVIVNAGPTMIVSDLVPNVTSLQTTQVATIIAHTSAGDDPWPTPPPPPPPSAMSFATLAKFLNKTVWTGDGLRVAGPGGVGMALAGKQK